MLLIKSIYSFLIRHLRKVTEETPTHTGGLSHEAKVRIEERNRRKGRGVAASTKEKCCNSKYDKGKLVILYKLFKN